MEDAAAGMAGSDPFRTGNTAFRLGMAKALVPFVFVFSPSLLLVAKGFTVQDFTITFVGCILGIVVLAAALSRFMLVELRRWEQMLCETFEPVVIEPYHLTGLGIPLWHMVYFKGRARS